MRRTLVVVIAIVAVMAFVYYSEAAMTWLRVTLHGR
jgi:hypothetical protein